MPPVAHAASSTYKLQIRMDPALGRALKTLATLEGTSVTKFVQDLALKAIQGNPLSNHVFQESQAKDKPDVLQA